MQEKIRWGIIGTGAIATEFATGLKWMPDAQLLSVGSRTRENADRFADKFGVPKPYGSYEGLTADPDVDVVYVATPHTFHKENSLLCLAAGKAVLCEKPFTINAPEAQEVVDLAREKKLFLMEGMWARFLPVMVKFRQLLADGAIGEPRMLFADFGFRADIDPQGRLFNPELGGGSLLDVGIYPLSLSSMVFGTPSEIEASAHFCETGVDEQAAVVLKHEQGQLSLLSSALRTATCQEAVLMGTEGMMKIHFPWWHGIRITLSINGEPDELFELPYECNGYNCEAAEVMNCLRTGKLESETMPLGETVAIMKTMDKIRGQCGLKYPME